MVKAARWKQGLVTPSADCQPQIQARRARVTPQPEQPKVSLSTSPPLNCRETLAACFISTGLVTRLPR